MGQVANVGAPEDKARALRLLRHVAKLPDGVAQLTEAGFLDTCVTALRDESPAAAAARQQSVGALLALAGSSGGGGGGHTRARMLYSGVVPGVVALLDSDGGEAVQVGASSSGLPLWGNAPWAGLSSPRCRLPSPTLDPQPRTHSPLNTLNP